MKSGVASFTDVGKSLKKNGALKSENRGRDSRVS